MRRLIAVTCIAASAIAVGGTAAVLSGSPSPASETAAPSAARGKKVFSQMCTGCHKGLGKQAGGIGPKLKGVGLTRGQITRQVKNGGGGMPAGLVSGAKLADVVAYVVSIQKK